MAQCVIMSNSIKTPLKAITMCTKSCNPQILCGQTNQPAIFLGKARIFITICRYSQFPRRFDAKMLKGNPYFDRFNLVQSWLKNRLSKFSGDIYSQTATGAVKERLQMPLPTRVLDLGECLGTSKKKKSQASNQSHSIRLMSPPNGSTGQYITLSHRWGKGQHLTLTRKNMESFHKYIPFTSLPKTFRDAVMVTRNLGYQYLWIDAMCIVQDDPQDWLRESAKMASVYHNACCTISAHTAKDDNNGFLHAKLESIPLLQFIYKDGCRIFNLTLASNFRDQVNNQVNKSFLSQRAWVFQERILSRRILHFVQHHIFFEDASGVKADDIGGTGRPLMYSPWEDNKLNVQDACDGTAYWYNLVERYRNASLRLTRIGCLQLRV